MPKDIDSKQRQYFIAVIPPPPIYDDALKLKHYFADKYQTKAALKSPPHITLHMPFQWAESKELAVADQLTAFARGLEPVRVCVDNFSSFPPRVIFLSITKSESLDHLQKSIHRFCKIDLNLFNANYKELPYHPHLTLAFRDLKKSAYKEAWKEFAEKEYKAEFIADRIALLKHNGKIWTVFREMPLQSSFSPESRSALKTTEG